METELIVKTDNTNASLDLSSDIPVSLNYLIADIKDPSKRNGAFSKSIKLPGTNTNNIFFEHVYDVNVVTNNFNPNLKTECFVLQDSIEVFRGYLRLRGIDVELVNDTQKISYDVTILGDNQDLYGVIGDSKLQDLDMSEFDHVYNRVNQYATWTATTGQGYVYPLIDYGYNNFLTNSFNVEHFRPAFYAKAYIDKIFAAAGKTYTSTFFNSTFFKKWIIPHNGDKFTMSSSNLALYEFYAGNSGAITSNTKSLVFNGAHNDWWTGDMSTSTSSSYTMKYNDDTTSPFVDTGNIYSTGTGVITIAQNGTYNINFKTDFEIKLATVPAGTATIHNSTNGKWPISYKVLRSTDGGVTWNIVSNDTPNFQTLVMSTTYQTFTKTFVYSASLNSGDQIRLLIHPLYSVTGYGVIFKDGGGTPISAGTASIDWRFKSNATVKQTLSIGDYVSGQTLNMSDAIPKDIKQKDFLTSIIRMGNLYVDVDPNDSNNYLIETRDDFYSAGSTKDWTLKQALDRPFNIKLMAEVDIKNFIYKYKSDQDYYNKKYEDVNSEVYGTYKKEVQNDFTLKDDITEVIFSPTPVVDNINNSLIIPKIFSYDGTSVKPQKHNIRILMYNGVETMTSGTWNYVAPAADALGVATLAMSTYPASAMVDSPLAPTESIEWGVPNMVFYSLGLTYTTNHIYNREYSKQITEITDRDSRIVTGYFYLDATDIATFDFRDTVYVKDTYYYVNKISDYNQIKSGLAKVELLKIQNANAYTPTTVSVTAIETNSSNVGIYGRYAGSNPTETNFGGADNVLLGDNNTSRSAGSYISGSRNSVSSSCYKISVVSCELTNVENDCINVNMMGCSAINIGAFCSGIVLTNCNNVNVEDLVYNFTGINLSNETITTAMNGVVKMGAQAAEKMQWVTKTASFTVDPAIQAYEIDRTLGDITATFDFTTMGNMNYYFKIIDSSANKFYIDEVSGTPSVDGNALPYDTGAAQWDDFKVGNDGTNFLIL